MRCRVGNWKTGLSVMFDEEAFDFIASQGRVLSVCMRSDRGLELRGTSKSTGRRSTLDRFGRTPSATKKCVGFFADAEVQLDVSFLVPGFQLPLFCLHEVGVSYDDAYDALVTEPLGADHLLPWPDDKHRHQRLSAAELMHQCYLRIRSHMLAGGHGYFDEVGVPVEVVRVMAGGYKLMLEKARAELDMAREAA